PTSDMVVFGSKIYGVTSSGGLHNVGVLYSVNTDGTGYTILHTFNAVTGDGSIPSGGLTLIGATLYGLAQGAGANFRRLLYSIGVDGSTSTILHNFNTGADDGVLPRGTLTYDSSSDEFYGATIGGGPGAHGIIFSINSDGSGFTVVHGFSGADGDAPYGELA